jgi:hypothetical protein
VVGGSHRGRVYLGPLNSSAVQSDGRTPTVAQSNTVVSALATLMGFTTNGVQLAVWSRKLLAAQPVTSVGVRPLIGVQRRRLS